MCTLTQPEDEVADFFISHFPDFAREAAGMGESLPSTPPACQVEAKGVRYIRTMPEVTDPTSAQAQMPSKQEGCAQKPLKFMAGPKVRDCALSPSAEGTCGIEPDIGMLRLLNKAVMQTEASLSLSFDCPPQRRGDPGPSPTPCERARRLKR